MVRRYGNEYIDFSHHLPPSGYSSSGRRRIDAAGTPLLPEEGCPKGGVVGERNNITFNSKLYRK